MRTVARVAAAHATKHEHAAWDCSSVPRRLATLIQHFRRHLNEKDVQEDCILALHSLLKVPAVALMLPCGDTSKRALHEIEQAGAEIAIVAETSFRDSPRMLYVLKAKQVTTQSPVEQLQNLLEVAAAATLHLKPAEGPWLWALHEPDVSAALLICEALDDTETCFWRALRSLRILSPVCLVEQLRHVRDQYAPCTTYILAWMSLYAQGMWPLLCFCVPFAFIFNEKPELLGASSWEFYTLQVVVILWAVVMIGQIRSRARFLDSYEAGKGNGAMVDGDEISPTSKHVLQKIMSRTGSGDVFAAPVNLIRNPDYQKATHPKIWAAWCVVLSGVAGMLCLTLAVLFLLFTMELKFLLIYEWGDCYKLGCRDPSFKHGFAGTLSMIACDILMALLIAVATGELCKAFARQIAKNWNFHSMILRLFVEHFMAISIDMVATIGVFAYLAFSFLPEWEETPETEWWDSAGCVDFWDFQVCQALRSCAPDDPVCCAGTLFCARSKLSFHQRWDLFEAWLGGLFVVAPFVEVLMEFIVPLVAYVIYAQVQISRGGSDAEEDRKRAGACCCRCLQGLGRLLAFIFVLDGGVLGLRYIFEGFPFRPPKIIEQMTSKAFGPLCLVCSREMEWTGAETSDGRGWTCRHHDVCRSSSANKGPYRWHCKKCHIDICEDCHPQGATMVYGLFGPLDQRLLRQMEPLSELKLVKMNFLILVMFAPMNPIGLIPQMFARQLDLRSRLPKLLMVRRRNFPDDNRLAHTSQTMFCLLILPLVSIWHTGLTLVSANPELHMRQSEILFAWLSAALAVALLALLVQWLIARCHFGKTPPHGELKVPASRVLGKEDQDVTSPQQRGPSFVHLSPDPDYIS